VDASGSPETLTPFGRVTFTGTHINEARLLSSSLTQVDLEDSPRRRCRLHLGYHQRYRLLGRRAVTASQARLAR
jgi:hypothetical protein